MNQVLFVVLYVIEWYMRLMGLVPCFGCCCLFVCLCCSVQAKLWLSLQRGWDTATTTVFLFFAVYWQVLMQSVSGIDIAPSHLTVEETVHFVRFPELIWAIEKLFVPRTETLYLMDRLSYYDVVPFLFTFSTQVGYTIAKAVPFLFMWQSFHHDCELKLYNSEYKFCTTLLSNRLREKVL